MDQYLYIDVPLPQAPKKEKGESTDVEVKDYLADRTAYVDYFSSSGDNEK